MKVVVVVGTWSSWTIITRKNGNYLNQNNYDKKQQKFDLAKLQLPEHYWTWAAAENYVSKRSANGDSRAMLSYETASILPGPRSMSDHQVSQWNGQHKVDHITGVVERIDEHEWTSLHYHKANEAKQKSTAKRKKRSNKNWQQTSTEMA